jgi:hypothetical protein
VYHCIAFDELDEGAAFIAALSRYLSSPSGRSRVTPVSPIEVLATWQPEARQLIVYLSDAALTATNAAFGQPALVGTCAADAVPVHRIAILSDPSNVPFGKDDVVRRITLVEADKHNSDAATPQCL